MHAKTLLLASVVSLGFLSPVSAGDPDLLGLAMLPWTAIHCDSPEVHAAEEAGLDPYTHVFVDPLNPTETVTVHLFCLRQAENGLGVMTDCTATSWSHTGWKWTTAYTARVDTWNPSGISSSTVVSRFATSSETWDTQVAANIFNTFSSGGSRANIAVRDNVNQHGWRDLSSTTIASTWTWSSGSTAVESDAAYNTDFAWATDGRTGAMDLQNIATHELGHTFGMGHSSSTSVNGCLTMYPSGSLGETQKRSLGDGDINGIRARYP